MIDKEFWLQEWKNKQCDKHQISKNGLCYINNIQLNELNYSCIKCPYD